MTTRFRTWLAALATIAALAAPGARARACGCSPEHNQRGFPACGYQVQLSAADSTVDFMSGSGITQPLDFTGNAVACSLSLRSTAYGDGELRVVQWDPLTLLPDPTSVALRTRSFNSSDLECGHIGTEFNPPLVTRALEHVAEPPRAMIAVTYEATSNFGVQSFNYGRDVASSWPRGYAYSGGGPLTPLPGPHAALGHGVCGGDAGVQALAVAQSVMTANALLDAASYEIIQRFRLPARIQLRWVEFAFGATPHSYQTGPGTITIVDAEGGASPPTIPRRSLVDASFYAVVEGSPFWGANFDFDRIVTLEPDHDYWLLVRVNYDYQLYARTLLGSEGPDFPTNIGALYRRTAPGGAWVPLAGRALDFRLIGEPVSTVGITLPGPSPASALRLRVAPNPARGATFVSWTGARSGLRFEVIDTRGRRVALGRASGAEGRWAWGGTQDDGRPVPVGVYFVRATDTAGTIAVDRVVLVR